MSELNLATKIWKHFCLVNKHRWYVFKLSIKAGIPFRGLTHDLSKYSPVEFFESAKYYDGNISPIKLCKKEKGYSSCFRNTYRSAFYRSFLRSRHPVEIVF